MLHDDNNVGGFIGKCSGLMPCGCIVVMLHNDDACIGEGLCPVIGM